MITEIDGHRYYSYGPESYLTRYETDETGKKRGVFRHVEVWEACHKQKVPDGCIVHHKDENKHNNEPDNLQAVTHSEHALIHGTVDNWSATGERTCSCGTVFTVKKVRHYHCSKKCAMEAATLTYRALHPYIPRPMRSAVCVFCSAVFQTQQPNTRTCRLAECKKKLKALRDTKRPLRSYKTRPTQKSAFSP